MIKCRYVYGLIFIVLVLLGSLLSLQRYIKHKEKPKTYCFISTMPKSGTWYTQYFLWSLSKLLKDQNFKIRDYNFQPGEVGNNFSFDNIEIKVGHGISVGYTSIKTDPHRKLWDKIEFWTPGYMWINEILTEKFFITKNKNAKIIYLFRNPLDQAVSLYFHAKNHKDALHRTAAKDSIQEFLLNRSAIDSYIKQYHTFRLMKKLYPNQILLVSYEELVRNPQATFMKICSFSNILENTKQNQSIVDLAVENSSKKNLRNIEKRSNRLLASDQLTTANNSHIRSGKIGTWKKYFTEQDLLDVDQRLQQFGYSLEEFTIQ